MTVNCPHCQQHLDCTGVMAGIIETCPTCEGQFEVPVSPPGSWAQNHPVLPSLPKEPERVSLFCQQCGAKLTMERQFQQVAGECPACKASFVVSPSEYPAVASRNNSFAVTTTGQQSEGNLQNDREMVKFWNRRIRNGFVVIACIFGMACLSEAVFGKLPSILGKALATGAASGIVLVGFGIIEAMKFRKLALKNTTRRAQKK